MADAVVSYAVQSLGNFLVEKATLLQGVKDQVEEVKNELELMQCFLRDADTRQGESETIRKLVSQIREATYDAEAVIEHFVLKSALRRRDGVVNHIKRYAFFINNSIELHQMGSRIESIKTRLSNLRAGLQTYGITELRAGSREVGVPRRMRKRQDYTHVVDYNVVGLDHKLSELVSQLLEVKEQHDDNSQYLVPSARRSVLSIYGMGGLGKTTLAKKVYSDSRIRRHFEGFAWIYLSQQFNARNVWESIITQLLDKKEDIVERLPNPSQVSDKDKKKELETRISILDKLPDKKEVIGKMTEDELTLVLYQVQEERKILVVIDDIWSIQAWNELSPAFPYLKTESGSKILVTTRNEDVALHADGGLCHNSLDTLNHSNSLKLLINTIQSLGGPDHPIKNKEERASEMVKQCGGLPLAIVVLGGILATKHQPNEWEKVNSNIRSFLNRGNRKDNDGVTSVLESSYHDLSYNLKSCFLYLSQYPEDYEIKTTQLMQMWIGEGFVSASAECWDDDGDETMEDVAEQYLNELVSRCLIQAGRRSCTGRVKTCRMHDLMRDLCISKAKEENFMYVTNLRAAGNEATEAKKVKSAAQIRRLSVFCDGGKYYRSETYTPKLLFQKLCPQVRSVLSFNGFDNARGREMESILQKSKSCRVLDIFEVRSKISLGKSATNLLHLRYLSLKASEIGALSSSMDNLLCLETLVLESGDDRNVVIIPNYVWRMEKLRHLHLPLWSRCDVYYYSQEVVNLQNLQTLVNFPPFRFDLQKNLVKLINVHCIRKLVISSRWREVEEIMTSQELVFNRVRSLSVNEVNHCVDLEGITRGYPNLLKFSVRGKIRTDVSAATLIWPSNLVKLVLRSSRLCDQTHIASLGQLQSLKILFLADNAFMGTEMILHENEFPQLQHLVLDKLEELEAWTVHAGALPSLSCLEMEDCGELKSVPDRFRYLRKLKEIQVRKMPSKFRKRLEPGGEDWHKVSHVPSISFF